MKKYQLNRGVIKGILDLCDDEGVFRKDFLGSLQIGFTELYGDNIFSIHSDITTYIIFTQAEFNICYAENYFIDESEEKMFKALKELHDFDIYKMANDYGVDVEVLGIMFSFLHEIFHMKQYLDMVHEGKSLNDLTERTKHLYDEVDRLEKNGQDVSLLYRSIPQERFADLGAIIFLVDHIGELIDIVQSNVEVVGLEEA